MEHTSFSFVPLLIVITLAFAVPIFLNRLKKLPIPIVVGEIIVGIIIGKSGFGWVEEGMVLSILSTFGFAYLMFLSGLEIDLNLIFKKNKKNNTFLKKLMNNPLLIGFGLFVMTLALSGSAALFLQSVGLIDNPWIIILVLSTTSLGIVLPVLKEAELESSPYGQLILVAALVVDFVSVFLLSFYVLLRSPGPTWEVLLILLLFVAFGITYRIAQIFREHPPAIRIIEEISSATSQIKLRGSFALALVFIALAESLGVEIILGAFMAGVIASLLASDENIILKEQLNGIGYGFFIPIFFIMVGVDVNLAALFTAPNTLVLLPILVLIAFVVKLIPALILRLRFGWRNSIAAGVLLTAHLSLEIAAAIIGLELGLINEAVNTAIIMVAITTSILAGTIFNRLIVEQEEEKKLVILFGENQSVELLAQKLAEHNFEIKVIRSEHLDPLLPPEENDLYAHLTQQDFVDLLNDFDANKAWALIAMEEDDEVNLRISRMARHRFQVPKVISWAQDRIQNERFHRFGIQVINPAYSTVLLLESMILNPLTATMLADIGEKRELRQVKLQNLNFVGKLVKDIQLPDDSIILQIERNGDIITPGKETRLQTNDTVMLIGSDKSIAQAARLFVSKK